VSVRPAVRGEGEREGACVFCQYLLSSHESDSRYVKTFQVHLFGHGHGSVCDHAEPQLDSVCGHTEPLHDSAGLVFFSFVIVQF